MGEDLNNVLIILYRAGAEDIPARNLAWSADMLPAINVALNMGYVRYREKHGERRFSLTSAGYDKIGAPAFSASSYLRLIFKKWLGR